MPSVIRPSRRPTVARDGADLRVSYVLCESHPLPVIDCSRAIKHALVRDPERRQRLNRWLYATRRPLGFMYPIGLLGIYFTGFITARIGRLLAMVSAFLTIVPISASFLAIRLDMTILLAQTYEFWYVTITNVIVTALLCLQFGDERCLGAIIGAIGNEYSLLMDAQNRNIAMMITGALVSSIVMTIYVVYESFGLIDEVRTIPLFHYHGFSLDSRDVVANGIGTITVLLARNALRRFKNLRSMRANRTNLRCISYRTRLRFAHSPPQDHPSVPVAQERNRHLSQLKLVPLLPRVDASDIVCVRVWAISLPQWGRVGLWVTGYVGLLSTTLSLLSPSKLWPLSALGQSGMVFSLMFFVVHFLHSNCGIWRRLVMSFDFWFMVVQSLLAHATIARSFGWDQQSIPMVINASWMTWVLSVDTLTPVIRRQLSYDRWFSTIVAVLTLTGLLTYTAKLFLLRDSGVVDHEILHVVVGAHELRMRALPFLVSRVVTIVFWQLRVLWRLWTYADDDLLILQGTVEYEDTDLVRRSRNHPHTAPGLAGVVPATT